MTNRKRAQRTKQRSQKRRTSRASTQRAQTHTKQPTAAAIVQRARQAPRSLSAGDVLQLQRLYGNRAVSQMVMARKNGNRATPIQTKLRVGPNGDAYEQEADRVANRVMGMSQDSAEKGSANGGTTLMRRENGIQTTPANRAYQSLGRVVQRIGRVVQRFGRGGFDAGPDVERRLSAQKGGGQPLPKETRAFMEPRFGADFKDVQVHTDNEADSLNDTLQAKAFTTGRDVYFKNGAYDPGSAGGQRLIAHELTHVVQQGGAGSTPNVQRAGTKPRSFSEGGTKMIKLSSEREEFVYKNKKKLGMAQILPKFYPVETTIIKGQTITHVQVRTANGLMKLKLKEPIQKPEEGQKVLCIETLGFESKALGEQKAGKGEKFVMDVKIGTHTKSLKQFSLEGATDWQRFKKNIEHGLKDKMARWVKKQSNGFKKIISKMFRGSRGRGYDICDGEVEFEEAHKRTSFNFIKALKKVTGDMEVIHRTMTKKDISFVGASVFAVFNLKNPENSVAKVIDPDHPILMHEIDEKIKNSAPPGVMTRKGYSKVLKRYNKLRRKLAKNWEQYQAKWRKGFRGGLTSLLKWFQKMLKIVSKRRKKILSRPLPQPRRKK